jgi:hypothetical protein
MANFPSQRSPNAISEEAITIAVVALRRRWRPQARLRQVEGMEPRPATA